GHARGGAGQRGLPGGVPGPHPRACRGAPPACPVQLRRGPETLTVRPGPFTAETLQKSALGLFAAAVLAAAWLSPRLVPFNMDEFSAYQPLGCHAYPLSGRYHLYREACHLYDLRLPFTDRFLPL